MALWLEENCTFRNHIISLGENQVCATFNEKNPTENDTFDRSLTGRAQIYVFDFAYETRGKLQASHLHYKRQAKRLTF